MTLPIRMVVTLKTSPDAKARVRASMQKLVPVTHTEAGCLQYDFYEIDADGLEGVPSTGGDFIVLEGWRDGSALQLHGASEHFQAFVGAFSKDELQMSVQLLKNG